MANKKHRNQNGDICYIFRWEQGGGNNVFAKSKKTALRRAQLFGASTHNRDGVKRKEGSHGITLIPIPDSLRSVTLEEYLEFDKGLYLLSI